MPDPVEIKVLSSIATREAYLELVPQFERATGHKVTTTWSGTTAIMKQMAAKAFAIEGGDDNLPADAPARQPTDGHHGAR